MCNHRYNCISNLICSHMFNLNIMSNYVKPNKLIRFGVEKTIFLEFQFKNWIYLQWVVVTKEISFFLVRPTIEYRISNDSNKSSSSTPLFKNLNPPKKQRTFEQIQIFTHFSRKWNNIFLILHESHDHSCYKCHGMAFTTITISMIKW